MGHSAVHIASERKRRTSSPPVTCIVNDAHLGGVGVCGKVAAEDRECSEPVCADHLCQYRRSNGHRCKKLPLRLASRLIYTAAGWYTDTSESVFCEKHEKHNCMGSVSGTVRCSVAKIPGQAYCRTHAVVMCKWQKKDGSLCAEMAYPQSIYCGGHCWCAFPPAGWPSDFPACYREPLEGQPYCGLHDGYFRALDRVMLDAQAGGRYG
jgi:hypothetical protein